LMFPMKRCGAGFSSSGPGLPAGFDGPAHARATGVGVDGPRGIDVPS
jgi:hypothetical protein